MRVTSWTKRGLLMAGAMGLALAGGTASAEEVIVGLITKTNNNPFFVKMKEGADAKAKEVGVELRSFAGKYDGDNEGQVAAVESLISAGAKGILITPSDTKAIVPTIQKAREAGILVIALDTPLDPIDAADATLATDNFKAGLLIGAVGRRRPWATRRRMRRSPSSMRSRNSRPPTCCATRAS